VEMNRDRFRMWEGKKREDDATPGPFPEGLQQLDAWGGRKRCSWKTKNSSRRKVLGKKKRRARVRSQMMRTSRHRRGLGKPLCLDRKNGIRERRWTGEPAAQSKIVSVIVREKRAARSRKRNRRSPLKEKGGIFGTM